MLDEDGGGDVAGKVVFLSQEEDLLKILHERLLEKEGVVVIMCSTRRAVVVLHV